MGVHMLIMIKFLQLPWMLPFQKLHDLCFEHLLYLVPNVADILRPLLNQVRLTCLHISGIEILKPIKAIWVKLAYKPLYLSAFNYGAIHPLGMAFSIFIFHGN